MDELSLCLVTDRTQTRGRDLVAVVGECLAAGLPAVQVREKDLGPGTYEIEVWHEKLKTKTATVTISGDEAKVADFTFTPPQKAN